MNLSIPFLYPTLFKALFFLLHFEIAILFHYHEIIAIVGECGWFGRFSPTLFGLAALASCGCVADLALDGSRLAWMPSGPCFGWPKHQANQIRIRMETSDCPPSLGQVPRHQSNELWIDLRHLICHDRKEAGKTSSLFPLQISLVHQTMLLNDGMIPEWYDGLLLPTSRPFCEWRLQCCVYMLEIGPSVFFLHPPLITLWQ